MNVLRFGTQLCGGASMVAAGYYTLESMASPCFTAAATGYVLDATRGLTVVGSLLIYGSLFYTGANLAGKIHHVFCATHPQRA